MALPDFDPLKHHVGLGPVGSTSMGFILSGAYRADPQRLGGSPEYGGESDVLTAGTLARWSQDDFSGGGYQLDSSTDPAMFADCKSLLPNLTERSARTVPPLVHFAGAGNVDAADALGVFATGGNQISVIDADRIRFYDAVTGTLQEQTGEDPDPTVIDPAAEIYAAVHDPADNLVYAVMRAADPAEPSNQLNGSITAGADELTLDSNSGFPTKGVVRIGDEVIYYEGKTGGVKLLNLQRGREGTDAAAHDDNAAVNYRRQFYLAKCTRADGFTRIGWIPNSAKAPPRGMCVTAGRDILVQMDSALWLLDVNDERDSLTAVRIGRLPGRWQDAVTYNGQSYILLTDSEQATQLVAWDGTQVLPVTPIPYNFLGKCLAEYAGRIYVGGRGRDLSDADIYAELYEVSGASLRLVKSFAAEARAGRTAVPSNFFSMVVHEGLLFLGTDIGELIAYDVTRDALWPGVQLYHADGHTLEARNLLSTRQKLLAWCFDQDVTSPDPGFYRLATSDADLASVLHTQFLETSDFMPEPDRDKRWATVRLVTRYDNCSLEVSQDSGGTWAGVVGTVVADDDLKIVDYDLSALDPSPAIRFRWTMGSSSVAYKEFVAFTCSFLWLDSGKQVWSFTVLGAEMPENVDGVAREQDVAALRSTLRGYWQNRDTLTYTDLDGTEYTVYMSDFGELQPQIAQAVDEDGTREAFYSVVLTEL